MKMESANIFQAGLIGYDIRQDFKGCRYLKFAFEKNFVNVCYNNTFATLMGG
jgi:hypothetical protein